MTMKKIIGLVALVLSIIVIQIMVDIYEDKMLIDILSGGANMSTKGYGAYSISTTKAEKVIDSLIKLSEQYDMNLTVDNFLEARFDMVIQSDGSILYPQRNVLYHFQHQTKLSENNFNGSLSYEDFNKLESPMNFSDLFIVAQSEKEQKDIAQEFNNILEDDYGENSLYFTSKTSNLSLDWSRNAFNKILLTNILLSVVIIMNSYLSMKIYFEMQQKRIAVFRLHGYSIHRQYLPQILSYLGLSIVLIIIAANIHINQIHAIPVQLNDYVITGITICGIDILLWLWRVSSVPKEVMSTLKNK